MREGKQPGAVEAQPAVRGEQRWIDRDGDDIGQKHVMAAQL